MSGELLADGDALSHVCVLPPVPSLTRHYPRSDTDPTPVEHTIHLINAVARCDGCGELAVSREDPEGWTGVRWVRLRWWHRAAHRKLREQRSDAAYRRSLW